jgi:hypothetical protein
MDLSSITREQKLFAGTAASALFVIGLFLPWYSIDLGPAGSDSANGWDVLPASWILLVLAAASAVMLLAEAMDYELPLALPPIPVAGWAMSVCTIVTFSWLIDSPFGSSLGDFGPDRAWGMFLSFIVCLVALAAIGLVWREDR